MPAWLVTTTTGQPQLGGVAGQIEDARDELELLAPVHVAVVDVDDAVAVEKQRRPRRDLTFIRHSHRAIALCPCRVEIVLDRRRMRASAPLVSARRQPVLLGRGVQA